MSQAELDNLLTDRREALRRLFSARQKLAELVQVLGSDADRPDIKAVLLDLMTALEE